jgi:hypothetical protein
VLLRWVRPVETGASGVIFDRIITAAGVTVTLFVAVRFVLLRAGLSVPATEVPVLALVLTVGALVGNALPPPAAHRCGWDVVAALLVTAVAAVTIAVPMWPGYILPTHDPIAVPLFAQIVATGRLLTEAYAPGDSGFAYPPGFPILLAPLFAVLDPYRVLADFKFASLAIAAAIPLTWAWMLARLFPSPLPLWQHAAASCLAFVGIERTLAFALPFAGKNAQLLAALLAPIVIVVMIERSRARWGWVLGAAALFGLVLIHFAALHLVAALLAGYCVVALSEQRVGLRQLAALVGMGVLAAGLLVAMLHAIVQDPRGGGFGYPQLSQGIVSLARTFVSRHDPVLVISDESPDFGVTASPYRGLLLLLCAALCLAAPWLRPVDATLRAARAAAMACFVAILISLAFAYRLVPAPKTTSDGSYGCSRPRSSRQRSCRLRRSRERPMH